MQRTEAGMNRKPYFDKDYFDRDFYTGETGLKGNRRDQDCPGYNDWATRIKQAFGSEIKTVLDIGAGVGIRTLHHIENDYDAYPCDISDYARDNSVLPDKHIQCDIRELYKIDRTFDLVIAERVICYLPAEYALQALQQIDKKADKYIAFNIICSDHKLDWAVEVGRKSNRLNIAPKKFWNELFSMFENWELDKEKTDIMLNYGEADCFWVFKVKKYEN